MAGNLQEDLSIFMIISRSFLLRMRCFQKKSRRKNQNTHFIFSNYYQKSCRVLGKWKNMILTDRPQMTTRRMRIACWVTKAKKHTLRICNKILIAFHSNNGNANALHRDVYMYTVLCSI